MRLEVCRECPDRRIADIREGDQIECFQVELIGRKLE
jgi:hypothetical protein